MKRFNTTVPKKKFTITPANADQFIKAFLDGRRNLMKIDPWAFSVVSINDYPQIIKALFVDSARELSEIREYEAMLFGRLDDDQKAAWNEARAKVFDQYEIQEHDEQSKYQMPLLKNATYSPYSLDPKKAAKDFKFSVAKYDPKAINFSNFIVNFTLYGKNDTNVLNDMVGLFPPSCNNHRKFSEEDYRAVLKPFDLIIGGDILKDNPKYLDSTNIGSIDYEKDETSQDTAGFAACVFRRLHTLVKSSPLDFLYSLKPYWENAIIPQTKAEAIIAIRLLDSGKFDEVLNTPVPIKIDLTRLKDLSFIFYGVGNHFFTEYLPRCEFPSPFDTDYSYAFMCADISPEINLEKYAPWITLARDPEFASQFKVYSHLIGLFRGSNYIDADNYILDPK